MSDQSALNMINRRIQDGQNYIDQKQYANAKEVLESARDNMPGLTVLWFRKGGLKKKINKMLAEPALVESTHRSRVKYKGNYVDRDTAMALGEMARMEQAAAQQLANGQDDEAIRSYSQALNYISAYPVLADEQKRLDAIVKKTSVGLLLKQAAQAEKQNNWDNADDLYREAETRLRESAAESAAITAEYAPIVQKRRSGFRLRRTLGQAAEAMSKNRLDSARSYLQQARQMQATSQDISREDSVATTLDAYSQYWNPSKYAFMDTKAGISFSYTPWLSKLVNDIALMQMTGFYKLGTDENQAISASLRYFTLGKLETFDELGESMGEAHPNEFAVDLGYSRQLSENFSMAIALRYIRSDQSTHNTGENQAGNAFAADFVQPEKKFLFPAVIFRNTGS